MPHPATPSSPPAADVFALPDRLAAKRDPALIAADAAHLARIADTLDRRTGDLRQRLDEARRAPGGAGRGQQALDRDQEIHRLSAELRTLRRFGADLSLGRMVRADGEIVYIGRLGLTDGPGERLLLDWRSPAAEPFFAAGHGDPHGLASRRRYRWTRGRITDYWDEAYTDAARAESAALDDSSAFIASLATARTARMRDVLGTIAADQDAIIRASSRGALVVDGGPGTGKTVVALHRAAYLLFADPRLSQRHGGILVVGPSAAYLDYVEDVLPSLGEEGVRLATPRDLVPEGAGTLPEPDAAVAALKGDARMLGLVERAVAGYEQPPTGTTVVETDWLDLEIDAAMWADAFAAVEPGTPHDDARTQIEDALVELLQDRVGDEVPERVLRRALAEDEGLRAVLARAWPVLDPVGVVADLWAVPDHLRACTPDLTEDERRMLHRPDARAWTTADLPFLDQARYRIGDPEAASRARRRAAAEAAQRAAMDRVVDDLLAAHEYDDGEGLAPMLRGADVRQSLVDEAALPTTDVDALAGPFAHLVVDEAQELTDAEWAMLLRRCPSRSVTIVGDRAQARRGFPESWEERLSRVGFRGVVIAPLSINYRTPEEVMAAAEPVIRAAVPDANVPTSVRASGIPVRFGAPSERDTVLAAWTAAHPEGVGCVIGDPTFIGTDRIRSLSPAAAKGLEFDLVVLVAPEAFGDGIAGAVDRYVAMTRATRELVVLRGADA